MAQQPEEKVKEFWIYFEQIVRRHKRDAGTTGVVDIVDWDGFRLSSYASKDGKIVNFFSPIPTSVAICVKSSPKGRNS